MVPFTAVPLWVSVNVTGMNTPPVPALPVHSPARLAVGALSSAISACRAAQPAATMLSRARSTIVGVFIMGSLEVLTGGDDPLDLLPLRLGLAGERLDVDDPLALLAGDLRPVVRVGRVRQVLVLLELLAHRAEQVVGADAFLAAAEVALERQLLGPPHDRLNHRA